MLLTVPVNKRRIIHIKKPTIKKPFKKTPGVLFKEETQVLKEELINLLNHKNFAKEIKFLRRIAIHIKQLHYNAQKVKQFQNLKSFALQIEHFLATPLGAPFVSHSTLLQAADTYGEQDPKHSDLSELLDQLADYGQRFRNQILAPFYLIDAHYDLIF